MFYGFAFRVSLILVPILIVGIVTSSFLSIYNYKQTSINLLQSRFEFVTGEIRDDIQQQLDLGLALENLEIAETLEVYGLDDQQILSIEIFDAMGTVLHSSDSSTVGDLVPEEWVQIWRLNSEQDTWSTQENDAGVVGTPVFNNLGQNVASLALRYSQNALAQNVAVQAKHLLYKNSIAATLTILIAAIGVIFLLRRTSRELRLMGRIMDRISNEENKQVSLSEVPESDLPTFRKFILSVESTYKDMDDTIAKARAYDEGK